jgi:DDE superfamily endonuclease
MTKRCDCPAAPGPLEDYASAFDDLFGSLAQRRGFREYLQGLLLPRDRNKTLTGLANTEPIVGAQDPGAQRLQFFLSESPWDLGPVNERRLELLLTDPATAPHSEGVLVIDETGDRKDGTKTAHVARQYLGSIGKTDNGIVAVSSLWADPSVYYPLHVAPYTPASRLPKGKADPAFRTKPQIAVELVDAALAANVPFRAIVADCLYGENPTFEGALSEAGLPFVLGLRPSKGVWAPIDAAHTPKEAAQALVWHSSEESGDWTKVERILRDEHTEMWWTADLRFGSYGPGKVLRIIVATTDPQTLPDLTTWYLSTNLPHPDAPSTTDSLLPPADLAEIVRLYGLRNWVEQGYRQVKQELGWADFMVRSDQAIRRHWELVCCAFSFCWRDWFHPDTPPDHPSGDPLPAQTEPSTDLAETTLGGGKNQDRRRRHLTPTLVAPSLTSRPELAQSVDVPAALLARLVRSAPTIRAPSAHQLGR